MLPGDNTMVRGENSTHYENASFNRILIVYPIQSQTSLLTHEIFVFKKNCLI